MRRLLVLVLLACLSGCGKERATRVPHWIEALKAPDARLRRQAAFTLGNLATTDAGVVPALTAALKDADAGVRCEAILALVKCGPEARQAVPVLRELQRKDRDARVRSYASQALAKVTDDL
jgi:HEAT repeat protein